MPANLAFKIVRHRKVFHRVALRFAKVTINAARHEQAKVANNMACCLSFFLHFRKVVSVVNIAPNVVNAIAPNPTSKGISEGIECSLKLDTILKPLG